MITLNGLIRNFLGNICRRCARNCYSLGVTFLLWASLIDPIDPRDIRDVPAAPVDLPDEHTA